MSASQDPATIGVRIEALIQSIGTLADPHARAQAEELVRLLVTLYGTGLARMLDIVRTERGGPDATLERFVKDGLISSLLVLHDLHPHPVGIRVERALAALQPHLPRDMTLILAGISGDTVHLRIEVSAPAHPASGIRIAVERAIQEAAPEIAAIEIEGPDEGPAEALLQIVRRHETGAAPGPMGE